MPVSARQGLAHPPWCAPRVLLTHSVTDQTQDCCRQEIEMDFKMILAAAAAGAAAAVATAVGFGHAMTGISAGIVFFSVLNALQKPK